MVHGTAIGSKQDLAAVARDAWTGTTLAGDMVQVKVHNNADGYCRDA